LCACTGDRNAATGTSSIGAVASRDGGPKPSLTPLREISSRPERRQWSERGCDTTCIHRNIRKHVDARAGIANGENQLIAGFIIAGAWSKQILIRGLGPSLAAFGLTGTLQDPVLDLRTETGTNITVNDNWALAANAAQIPANLRPTDPRESAIWTTLAPGSYTAIESGKSGATGTGLLEVYDVDSVASSQLANISTRGLVGTGNDVMIGGYIVRGGASPVLVRALGPSLAPLGVVNVLTDPTIELRDANGVLVAANDNWKQIQQTPTVYLSQLTIIGSKSSKPPFRRLGSNPPMTPTPPSPPYCPRARSPLSYAALMAAAVSCFSRSITRNRPFAQSLRFRANGWRQSTQREERPSPPKTGSSGRRREE